MMARNEQDSLLEQAISLRDDGDFVAAARLLRPLTKDLGDRVAFWLLLGGMEEEQADLAAAAKCYEQAVQLAPTHELSSRSLFHALWRLGRQGDDVAESMAIAEMRRYTTLAGSEWYEKIINEIHVKRDILWPGEGDGRE